MKRPRMVALKWAGTSNLSLCRKNRCHFHHWSQWICMRHFHTHTHYKLCAKRQRNGWKPHAIAPNIFTSEKFRCSYFAYAKKHRTPSDESIIVEIAKHYKMNMHTNNANKLLIPPLQYLLNGFHLIAVTNTNAPSLSGWVFFVNADFQFHLDAISMCWVYFMLFRILSISLMLERPVSIFVWA